MTRDELREKIKGLPTRDEREKSAAMLRAIVNGINQHPNRSAYDLAEIHALKTAIEVLGSECSFVASGLCTTHATLHSAHHREPESERTYRAHVLSEAKRAVDLMRDLTLYTSEGYPRTFALSVSALDRALGFLSDTETP